MSKEIKIGLITILTLAVMIWGFQYLKGKNILKKGYTFETVLGNVEGLDVATPVEINGLPVGAVSNIRINPENVKSMIVTFDIEGDFKLPTNTRAINAAPPGVIGNRKIILDFNELCDGTNCLQGGERLESGVRGMIASVMGGTDEVDGIITDLRKNLGPMMDTVVQRITSQEEENAIGQSLHHIEGLTKNLSSLTANLDRLLQSSYGNINTTMKNLAEVSGSFANSKEDLEKMITNLSNFTEQMDQADLGGTLAKTGETIESTNALLTGLKTTVDQANTSFGSVNSLLQKVDTGTGTIGKLLNDPEIYYNLESTSKHLALLLQDLRLNPKRYVRLSVFGRKGNQYTSPEGDPAFQLYQEEDVKKEVPEGN